MAAERAERRLAAILAAGVAGYSWLMGADEEGTRAALKAIRRELGDPKIAEHRSRILGLDPRTRPPATGSWRSARRHDPLPPPCPSLTLPRDPRIKSGEGREARAARRWGPRGQGVDDLHSLRPEESTSQVLSGIRIIEQPPRRASRRPTSRSINARGASRISADFDVAQASPAPRLTE